MTRVSGYAPTNYADSQGVLKYLQVYYKEAVGAFVVFDVTRLSTFEAVQMWKADLDNKVLLPNGKPIPAVLLANKVSSCPPLSLKLVSYTVTVPTPAV